MKQLKAFFTFESVYLQYQVKIVITHLWSLIPHTFPTHLTWPIHPRQA